MYITSLSKKLITGIVGVTFVGVAMSGLFFSESNTQSDQTSKVRSQKDKENQAVIVKSLTNITQNVVFTPKNTLDYVGYLQGAGYSSYQFYAQKGQLLTGTFKDEESQQFELILFGPQTRVVKSGTPLTIPANGLYDLRVVFRNKIEKAEEQKAQSQRAEPIIYHLSLSLKNPLVPKMND